MKNVITSLATLILSCLLFPDTVFSQYLIPTKENCEQLKGRTLLVEIKDSSDTGPNSANEILKRSFKDFWTFTPVEFLPTEAYKQKLASGGNNYASLLAYDDESTISVQHYSTTRTAIPSNIAGTTDVTYYDTKTTPSGSTKFYFSHYNLSISLMNSGSEPVQICTISFANDQLNTGDLQFAVQQMARLVNASLNDIKGLDYFDHTKNIAFVKTKTLLIPKEIFKEKDLQQIADIYKFPYRIVTMSEMNDLVISRDEQYIYPKIIWSIQHKAYGWITVWPREGNITSFMSFGGVHFDTHQEADDIIKVKDLKYITSGMAQGINNRYK